MQYHPHYKLMVAAVGYNICFNFRFILVLSRLLKRIPTLILLIIQLHYSWLSFSGIGATADSEEIVKSGPPPRDHARVRQRRRRICTYKMYTYIPYNYISLYTCSTHTDVRPIRPPFIHMAGFPFTHAAAHAGAALETATKNNIHSRPRTDF